MKPYPIQFVSIVIPVYNEEQSLPELLRRTEAACRQLTYDFEIVLVDDGSRDESANILQAAAEREGSPVVCRAKLLARIGIKVLRSVQASIASMMVRR